MRRLVPLEHILRLLVTVEAVTFLIMTREGRRLLRETPKTPILKPRVAPLVAKLSDEMNADGEMMEKEPGAAHFPSSNPAEWNAHFSVLRWRTPPAEALSRVLADRGPAVGRAAIVLAGLPCDVLAPPEAGEFPSR